MTYYYYYYILRLWTASPIRRRRDAEELVNAGGEPALGAAPGTPEGNQRRPIGIQGERDRRADLVLPGEPGQDAIRGRGGGGGGGQLISNPELKGMKGGQLLCRPELIRS